MSSVRRGRIALALACALLAGREGPVIRAQAPPTSSTASGALQRAITLVETRGDCRGALPELDTAARSADASVAPRALFMRGQCLERLGRQADARVTYGELVARFPTHVLARQARRRAQALATPANGLSAAPSLTLRRLDVADPIPTGSLSGDGRYLAFHNDDAVPFRRDLLTGRSERLTLGGESDGTRAGALFLSYDGQQLVFMWDVEGRSELRLASAVAGGATVTLVPAGDLQAIMPVAWAADGRTLLVVTIDAGFRLALRRVDVPSRRMDVLHDLGFVEPFFVSLSPDGRRVLFDHAPTQGPHDILLLDIETRRVSTVVQHGANDAMPVFLPDGRAFLFASDRLGPLSLWRQSLETGTAVPEPTLVRRDIGRIWAVGMTAAGTFVHGLQTGMIDVYVMQLGEDGVLAEQAAPLSGTFAGNNQAPDWSPDGRFLAYASTRGAISRGAGSRALVIRERATGQERLLFPDMLFLNAPRWSNDGTRLLVKGRQASTNQWGEFIVDAQTGAVRPVVVAQTMDAESELGPHQWVPGRDAILLGRHGKGLVEVDVATGVETMLVPLAPGIDFTAARGCAYAPDGRTLAWSVRQGRGPKSQNVLYVRDPDGTTRELLDATGPEWLQLMDWAPDGQSVYVVRQFAARPGAQPARTELWRVPIDGSAPSSTGLTAPALRGVSVHPDGRTIAYVTGFPTWEIWAMDGIK